MQNKDGGGRGSCEGRPSWADGGDSGLTEEGPRWVPRSRVVEVAVHALEGRRLIDGDGTRTVLISKRRRRVLYSRTTSSTDWPSYRERTPHQPTTRALISVHMVVRERRGERGRTIL
jgi:hypothetical protein